MPSTDSHLHGRRRAENPAERGFSASRGFVARKEGNSTMWRGNAQAINVTGDALWFDHKSGKGGVGTIDLVMHLDGQSFREAVHSLSGGRHGRFDAHPAVATPLAERRPLGELMDEYARRDDTRWPIRLCVSHETPVPSRRGSRRAPQMRPRLRKRQGRGCVPPSR